MPKQRFSSIDVARRAGVSQSTVSRVFSNGVGAAAVAPEMRERVLRAADELGYRPNALARAVFVGRSRIVAVLFSYLDNPFYADALEGICHGLQANGYHALVFMVRETTQDNDRVIGEILQYQVDGLITASVELSSEICQRCHDRGVPVVMFNRLQDDPRLSSVTTDNVEGGRAVARFLAGLGHRKIAMIAGWEGASTNRDRELGFAAGLAEAGLPLHARAVGHFDRSRAKAAARLLFAVEAGARPDALFVMNDYMAVPVLDTLRAELGLRVPEDVSVVGFDDIELAALPTYALTTFRQPMAAMVEAAVAMLMEMIEAGASPPRHVVLPGELVVRASTAPARRRPAAIPSPPPAAGRRRSAAGRTGRGSRAEA